MLGSYENFPKSIHRAEIFTSLYSPKKLQQRLIQALYEINSRTFSFDQIALPTIPNGTIIFEIGIADSDAFTYVDKEELEQVLKTLKKENIQTIDLFCAIRYYKNTNEKRTALKFDYYLLRVVFKEKTVEFQIFHEKGPRYISPEGLTTFIVNNLNGSSYRKLLKSVKTL